MAHDAADLEQIAPEQIAQRNHGAKMGYWVLQHKEADAVVTAKESFQVWNEE